MAFLDRVATGNQVLLDGESSYKTAREGSRWFVSNPTVATAITAQTSFSATTAFLAFDTNSSTRMIPNSIILAQTGTAAGGNITVFFGMDNQNRISSGTVITPKQTSMELSGTTGVTVNHTASLNTASANIRYFGYISIPADTGMTTQVLLSDGFCIGASSSFLVFASAATTGPSFLFNVEWIEERSST